MKITITLLIVSSLSLAGWAACPSMDATGDCRVNLADFAEFASQWLTEGSFTLKVYSNSTSGVNIASSTGHGGTTNYTKSIAPSTSVTLTAPPAIDDGTFISWTGDVAGFNTTISFVMNSDKTVLANYELTGSMVWVDVNDPGVPGHEAFVGEMAKYETTNAQYCEFLNFALASGDIVVEGNYVKGAVGSNPGEDFAGENYYYLAGAGVSYDGATYGGAARINYGSGVFIVDAGFEDHPVTYVSWYGATAFAGYYGWRLPTEWEWQAVADFDGTFTYGCGTTINNSIANYVGAAHPCGTAVVGVFGTYGYQIADLCGNIWEWTSTVSGTARSIRGGCWARYSDFCTVAYRGSAGPSSTSPYDGFRVCR